MEKEMCDICKTAQAEYDAKSVHGPWAFMCQACFDKYGMGLGLERGQRFVHLPKNLSQQKANKI